ncbi:MAG: hypothetical protein AAGI12_11840 [Pseudomonadota bacterium]
MIFASYGLVFGLVIGGIMRLPGMDAVVPAFGINLSVMAALWLGISIGAAPPRKVALVEVLVGGVTFVLVAAAMRTTPAWLYMGFGVQIVWSLAHNRIALATPSPRWFVPFSAAANLGFFAALSILVGL